MKGFMWIIALVLTLLSCAGEPEQMDNSEENVQGIAFFKGSWEEALAKAKSEGKLIFLDAYAEWCNPCKRMSESVFTNEALGAYFNEHFICVKMDMEKGIGEELAIRYVLESYPTLYFVDCTGKAVSTNAGFHTADQLMALGKIYFDQAPESCE